MNQSECLYLQLTNRPMPRNDVPGDGPAAEAAERPGSNFVGGDPDMAGTDFDPDIEPPSPDHYLDQDIADLRFQRDQYYMQLQAAMRARPRSLQEEMQFSETVQDMQAQIHAIDLLLDELTHQRGY